MMMAVVGAPRSAARSTGSRSRRVVSSTSRVRATMEPMDSVKDSRVRVTACFMRSKRPTLVARDSCCDWGSFGDSCLSRFPKRDEKTMLGLVYRIGAGDPVYGYLEANAGDKEQVDQQNGDENDAPDD